MANRLMSTAHEIASDLYETGVINAVTMREYEALTLTPVDDLTPDEIKKLRFLTAIKAIVSIFMTHKA